MTDNSRQINAENRALHTRESDHIIVPLNLTCRCGYVAPDAADYEQHAADIFSCSEYRAKAAIARAGQLNDCIEVGINAWEACASISTAIAEYAVDNDLRLTEADTNFILEQIHREVKALKA